MAMLSRLIRWMFPHCHVWRCVGQNTFGLSVHDRCRCGMERRVEVFGARMVPGVGPMTCMVYRWVTTAGNVGPWLSIATGEPVEVDESTRIAPEYGHAREFMILSLLRKGWQIKHDKGTAYVSMRHPAGGAYSLVEVKTYGTPLTVEEADRIASDIASYLQDRYIKAEQGEDQI